MTSLTLKLQQGWDRLITVRHPDPDWNRRGRLLSILLLGTGAAVFLGIFYYLTPGSTGGVDTGDISFVLIGLFTLILVTSLYLLNRFGSPRIAATIFLIGLVGILTLSDDPDQVVSGRTTVTMILPVVMASMVLPPWSSFIFAGMVSLALLVLATYVTLPSVTSLAVLVVILVVFLVALVAWLAGSSVEDALARLRLINRELDQRVADRTRDLAAALTREQAEASRNQAILESIADGVIVFDQGGQSISANPALSHLLELPRTQIVGHDLPDLMASAVPGDDQQEVIQVLNDPGGQRPPLKVRWDDKTLSMSFAPVRGSGGEQGGVVAVFRDFTREAEVERMKSAFVSMVSHELRTPLGAILGFIEILHEKVHGPLTPKQENVVVRIFNNTKRLLSLVGDLLDQAQIEAGKLSFHSTDFNPSELVESSVSIFANTAQSRNINLSWQVLEEVPRTLHNDDGIDKLDIEFLPPPRGRRYR